MCYNSNKITMKFSSLTCFALSFIKITSYSFKSRLFSSTRLGNSLKGLLTSSKGELGTLNYRLNYFNYEKNISPWHNIPLNNGSDFNFITEVKITDLHFNNSLLSLF